MKNNILEEGRRPMGTPFFGRKKLVRKIKNSLYEVRGRGSKRNTIATNIRIMFLKEYFDKRGK